MVDAATEWLSPLRNRLRSVGDLARMQQRIKRKNIKPAELQSFVRQLSGAWDCVTEFVQNTRFRSSFLALSKSHEGLTPLLQKLKTSISDEEGQLFLKGFDEKLDSLLHVKNNGDLEILSYLEREKERTGINNLKVKSHKTFGLLLEVSKSNLSKVPEDFLRKQTMTNHERFLTEELSRLFENLESAEQQFSVLEQELFMGFVDQASQEVSHCEEFVSALANLDLLQSFAWLSSKHRLSRPEVVLAGPFQIQGGRHLVVEAMVGDHRFVANDLEMAIDQKSMVITGPNMAGKSTYMRQTAIMALMSQIGCFVPARRARLPVFDAIYTRVGAADDLSRGQSTFMWKW
jgi:DNA mismatch repair protein MutS